MWQYPLSEFCFKHTRAVCSTFHCDGLLWQLHHSRSSNCYLRQSFTPLIPPLRVTVVVSFNIPWGQFGNKSSVFCNLHTETQTLWKWESQEHVSTCVSLKHLYISTSVCTWAHYIAHSNLILPSYHCY